MPLEHRRGHCPTTAADFQHVAAQIAVLQCPRQDTRGERSPWRAAARELLHSRHLSHFASRVRASSLDAEAIDLLRIDTNERVAEATAES